MTQTERLILENQIELMWSASLREDGAVQKELLHKQIKKTRDYLNESE